MHLDGCKDAQDIVQKWTRKKATKVSVALTFNQMTLKSKEIIYKSQSMILSILQQTDAGAVKLWLQKWKEEDFQQMTYVTKWPQNQKRKSTGHRQIILPNLSWIEAWVFKLWLHTFQLTCIPTNTLRAYQYASPFSTERGHKIVLRYSNTIILKCNLLDFLS